MWPSRVVSSDLFHHTELVFCDQSFLSHKRILRFHFHSGKSQITACFGFVKRPLKVQFGFENTARSTEKRTRQ